MNYNNEMDDVNNIESMGEKVSPIVDNNILTSINTNNIDNFNNEISNKNGKSKRWILMILIIIVVCIIILFVFINPKGNNSSLKTSNDINSNNKNGIMISKIELSNSFGDVTSIDVYLSDGSYYVINKETGKEKKENFNIKVKNISSPYYLSTDNKLYYDNTDKIYTITDNITYEQLYPVIFEGAKKIANYGGGKCFLVINDKDEVLAHNMIESDRFFDGKCGFHERKDFEKIAENVVDVFTSTYGNGYLTKNGELYGLLATQKEYVKILDNVKEISFPLVLTNDGTVYKFDNVHNGVDENALEYKLKIIDTDVSYLRKGVDIFWNNTYVKNGILSMDGNQLVVTSYIDSSKVKMLIFDGTTGSTMYNTGKIVFLGTDDKLYYYNLTNLEKTSNYDLDGIVEVFNYLNKS